MSSTGPATATGAILGTLAYMAPEQIRATRSLDARADVYALGAILYECLAGQPAFAAPTPPALMYKILEERPTPLAELRPELPRQLVSVVERALAYEREERFQSARDLEQALVPFSGTFSARALPSVSDDTDAGEAPHAALKSAWALTRCEQRPTWNVAVTIALAAGGLGLAAGSLLHEHDGARVTTTLQPVLPPVTAPSAGQAPERASSAGSNPPAAQPAGQPQPVVAEPEVEPRRRSPSRPAPAKALPAPSEAPSSIDGASARKMELERANPYRQKQ